MAERVVLHIGTMKSGTTYLQNALVNGADELEAGGAFYVGGRFNRQTNAVAGMLQPPAQRDPRKWVQLVEELHRRDGIGVFSQEFLSLARPANVAALVRTLEGLEVDVVLTVRDQRRAIPAQWQTYARNFGTSHWPEYLRELRPMVTGDSAKSLALRKFRRAQDVASIVDRWAGPPGVSSLTLVPVPQDGSDPTELWRRFCRAARLDVAAPSGARAPVNASLGYASCHVLTRINRTIAALPAPLYRPTRTRAVKALLPLKVAEGRPVLDRAGVALAQALNERIVRTGQDERVTTRDPLDELAAGATDEAPAEVPAPDPDEVRRAVERVGDACLPGTSPPADLDRAVGEISDHLLTWGREEAPPNGRRRSSLG